MLRLVQRLHIFAGLQTCVALVLFGVAGLSASFRDETRDAADGGGDRQAREVREVPFNAPSGASDRRLADLVYERLRPPLATRIPDFALKRNAAGQLALDFYTPNGVTRVLVLEAQHKLRVERNRVGLAAFLSNMHAVTWAGPGKGTPKLLVLWSVYTELSIFALFFLGLTGLYQWLATRARERLGQVAFVTGALAFVLTYVWMR